VPISLPRPLNSVRWDQNAPGGHVESWFLKANDPKAPERAFWLKFTLLAAPGGAQRARPALAEVWAIRFDGGNTHRAAKGSFLASESTLGAGVLDVKVGSCELGPGRVKGAVGEGASRLSFDLEFDYGADGGQTPIFGFPHTWMYEGGFPKSKLYTSCPNTHFRGKITAGDDIWEIEEWRGMLGHNWGVTHSPSYHWAQCSLFVGDDGPEDAVFEGFSGKIALGPFLSPWLSGGVLRYKGEDILLNSVGGLFGNKVRTELYRWSCVLSGGEWRAIWSVEAPRDDFVGLRYFDPGGRENHCLNSKIATCTLQLERKGARVANLRGERSCAYEILTRHHDHGVTVLA
jgi:hypothetical protein